MLQETRLTDREAVVVAGSLKNWAMFHQEEIQDSHARVEGGVAVLVRSDIPAIKAASWKGASGQWVRVCLPGLHVLSVYRTKGAASAVRDFNGSLSEECGSLGNVRLFIGGDFNGDPLVDGLNVLAAGFGGSVTYPLDDPSVVCLDGEEFRGHDEMDHEYCPLPAATRWDSSNCIDWGIKARISVSVRVSQEKWSDHKVLQWDVFAKDFQDQSSKLRPVRNLRKPSSISDKAWQQAIEQCWSEATREEAPLSTWEDLTSRVEQAMTSALLRVQEYRKAPAGVGQKGMPAWVLPRFRHHREHHLGPQPVKTCRFRRLFRRLVAWQTQNNDSLRKSLLREGDFFNCPLDLTDRRSFERSKQWLLAAIDSAEEEQRIKNIKRWNDELRNDDGAVWKWLAKARLTERVHAVKSDNNEVLSGSKMFDELELFWRDIWPQDAQTRRRIADLCIASESSPWPQMQEECPLPSIKGTEIRARARKNKNKASGPCGWANTEIMFWPAEALDHLAILFQNIEEGTGVWPEAMTQWKQVHLAKPHREVGKLENLRPISIGSCIYRLYSGIRMQHVSMWLTRRVPTCFHGGIKGRGTHTALTVSLCEMQKTQRNMRQANGQRVLRRSPGFKFLGASDLSKAFDKMAGTLAGASLSRMGLPQGLIRALEQAWTQQKRFMVLGSFVGAKCLGNIGCLPQGDPSSPIALLGPIAEAQFRLQQEFDPSGTEVRWGIFIDDRHWLTKASTRAFR